MAATPRDPKEQEAIDALFKWVADTLGIDLHKAFAGDDWTLIVKLHALIETGLNTSLVRHFSAPELGRIIAKLETSNMATGKVAFAKALGIISKESATFIQKLSELRNHCVHDIRNFDFDLNKYLENNLEEKERKAFLKLLSSQLLSEFQKAEIAIQLKLMAGTMNVIMWLFLHDYRCDIRDAEKEVQRLRAELYAAQNPAKSKEE